MMGLRYPNQISESLFFVTTTFKDWERYGETAGVYEALAKSLTFCLSKYDSQLPAFVFMPSHMHLLVAIDGKNLGDFMRDFKKYISQKAFPEIGITDSQVWCERYDRVAINNERVFRVKLDYIHNNPVKAGLVSKPEVWRWSSARSYFLGEDTQPPTWNDWR